MGHGTGSPRADTPRTGSLRADTPAPRCPASPRRGSISLSLLLALALAAHSASAQTSAVTVRGRVASFVSQEPLTDALVSIPGTELEARTDGEGRFVLEAVPVGVHSFRVVHDNTVSDRLGVRLEPARGDEIEIEILVDVDVVPLPPLRVSVEAAPRGKLAGFHHRRERASGVFFTRQEIEDRDPQRTSDLFRGLPGVRVSRFEPGSSSIGIVRGPTACSIDYFLDGIRVFSFDVDVVPPEVIDGIEVYRGPSEVPPQFRRRMSCAAIVIWTRDPAG